MTAEVRSRLVSKVAEALDEHLTEYGQGIAAWKDRDPPGKALAEVAVRTVCDLIADEIDLLDDAPHCEGDLGASEVGYRACRRQAVALVRSLGQP